MIYCIRFRCKSEPTFPKLICLIPEASDPCIVFEKYAASWLVDRDDTQFVFHLGYVTSHDTE